MTFEEDLKASLATLRKGGVIIYPTDTIWGLGCDAVNASAVEKIFRIKERDSSKSMLILVNGLSMLEQYVREVPEMAWELIEVSDRPITIIYPEGRNLAGGVCADDGSVGIRISNEPFCNELISRFRKPLVSTSANFSGKPSPSSFGEIEETLTSKADYVVSYRRDDKQRYSASPVIRFDRDGTFRIIRK